MARLSLFARQRIIHMRSKGMTYTEILQHLQEEGMETTRQTIAKFWNGYQQTGLIKARHGGGRKSLLSQEHLDLMDSKVKENNELTGKELQKLMQDDFQLQISMQSMLRWRRRLGWQFGKTKFCQMVSEKNRPLRRDFAASCIDTQDTFDDVIFVDESIVKMGRHVNMQCYKKGEPIHKRLRPKAKHPIQVGLQTSMYLT